MKQKAELVIVNAKQLLTLRGGSEKPVRKPTVESLGLIEDGFVASAGDKIIAIGPSTKLDELVSTSDALIIDAKNRVVMPGFVDSHTHSAFAGSREQELEMKLRGMTYMEILNEGGGIFSTVRATRSSSSSQLFSNTESRLRSMVKNGSTTIEVKSGYGLDTENELKILRVIKSLQKKFSFELVPTFLGAHAIPPEFKNPNEYTDFIVGELLKKVTNEKLAEFCDVFCEAGVFDVEQSRMILQEARKLGMELKIHADEFKRIGATRLAVELGATSADHLLHSTDEDIRLISRSNTIATLLPATPFCTMMENYARARNFLDSDCAVALASDLSPNTWCESMQSVIQLAVFKMKMKVHEAIVAATINGAHAINRGREIGSLEVGKKMNLIILDAPNFNFLAYRVGVNQVDTVVIRGKVLVEGGRLAA
jgi:imidazolonepropionase